MKKLIVARHGQYDNTGHLNDVGREQVRVLADKLKKFINKNMSVIVLASPASRTRESADIIASALGVKSEESGVLLSEGMLHPMNLSVALEFVKSRDEADVIILVTHFDYVADFPKYFSEKELGVRLPSVEIEKGEAWVVDCLEKSLTLVN